MREHKTRFNARQNPERAARVTRKRSQPKKPEEPRLKTLKRWAGEANAYVRKHMA